MNDLQIKEYRKKLKLTQLELANLIGVSLKTISNYENGGSIPDAIKQLLRIVLMKDDNHAKKDPFAPFLWSNLPEKKDLLKLHSELQIQIETFTKTIELLQKSSKNIEHQLGMIEIVDYQNDLAFENYGTIITEEEALDPFSKNKYPDIEKQG